MEAKFGQLEKTIKKTTDINRHKILRVFFSATKGMKKFCKS